MTRSTQEHNERLVKAAGVIFDELGAYLSKGEIAIAGGFVRDLLLNKRIKDIDVYVRRGVHYAMVEVWMLGKGMTKMEGSAEYDGGDEGDVEVWTSKDGSYQLIITNDYPSVYVSERFDIGLCQALLYGDGEIHTTPAFEWDVVEKCITICPRPTISLANLGNALANHYPRVQKKYPDYTLRVCNYPYSYYTLDKREYHV